MKRALLLVLAAGLLHGAQKVEILRDEFGVPHIFAATAAGAAFGSGYAQAEDRLEELLRNYRKAEGTMAEAFGPELVDARLPPAPVAPPPGGRAALQGARPQAARHLRSLSGGREEVHAGASRAGARLGAQARALADRRARPLHHLGLAGGRSRRATCKRGGIEPDPVAYHGSNEMLLAPSAHGACTCPSPWSIRT